MSKSKFSKQQGFSILEVSIASLVFAIGLLGVAAMQRLAWQESNDNYWRSIALQLSEDFAERAKGNHIEAGTGQYEFFGNLSDPGYDCEDSYDSVSVSLFCSSNGMAIADSFAFENAIITALPEGRAESEQIDNGVYQVTVSWIDPADGEPQMLQTHFVP